MEKKKQVQTGEDYWFLKCANCQAPGKYIEMEQLTCNMFVSGYKLICTLCDHVDYRRFTE